LIIYWKIGEDRCSDIAISSSSLSWSKSVVSVAFMCNKFIGDGDNAGVVVESVWLLPVESLSDDEVVVTSEKLTNYIFIVSQKGFTFRYLSKVNKEYSSWSV
jgi:hypothetical protein